MTIQYRRLQYRKAVT